MQMMAKEVIVRQCQNILMDLGKTFIDTKLTNATSKLDEIFQTSLEHPHNLIAD